MERNGELDGGPRPGRNGRLACVLKVVKEPINNPGVGNERDYLRLVHTYRAGSTSKILWIHRPHDALRRRANSAVVSGDSSRAGSRGTLLLFGWPRSGAVGGAP